MLYVRRHKGCGLCADEGKGATGSSRNDILECTRFVTLVVGTYDRIVMGRFLCYG
jgi:hypothetical protein